MARVLYHPVRVAAGETSMLGEPHDLVHEFPELESRIHELRKAYGTFSQLMDQYDEIDTQIRDLEALGQPVADETIEDLKKRRVRLKDRLYALLKTSA